MDSWFNDKFKSFEGNDYLCVSLQKKTLKEGEPKLIELHVAKKSTRISINDNVNFTINKTLFFFTVH